MAAVKTPPHETAGGRRKLAAKGQTAYGTSFPVPNVSYLKKALKAVGRVAPGKRATLGRFLRKRARALGATGVIKGSWADNTQGAKAMANALKAALELSRADGTLWELSHVNGKVVELVGPKGYIHGWIKVSGPMGHQAKIGEHVRVSRMAGPAEGQVIHRGSGGAIHIRTPKGERISSHEGMITHVRGAGGAPPLSGDHAKLVAHMIDVHQIPAENVIHRSHAHTIQDHATDHQSVISQRKGLSNHPESSLRHRKSTLDQIQGTESPGLKAALKPGVRKIGVTSGESDTQRQVRENMAKIAATAQAKDAAALAQHLEAHHGHRDLTLNPTTGRKQKPNLAVMQELHRIAHGPDQSSVMSKATDAQMAPLHKVGPDGTISHTSGGKPKALRIAGQKMTALQERDFNGLSSTNQDIYEERRQEGLSHADAMKGLAVPLRPKKTGVELEKTQLRNRISNAETSGFSAKGSPAEARLKKLESAPTSAVSHTAHADLLQARKDARAKYPQGHPERLKAERAVRQSRKTRRAGAGGGGGTTTRAAGAPRTSRRRRTQAPAATSATSAPSTGKSVEQRQAEVNGLLPSQKRTYGAAKRAGVGHERAMGVATARPQSPKGTAGRRRQLAEKRAAARAEKAPATAKTGLVRNATAAEERIAKRLGITTAKVQEIKTTAAALEARGWSKSEARRIAIDRVTKGTPIPQYAPGKKPKR